jgi:hypothetical protein
MKVYCRILEISMGQQEIKAVTENDLLDLLKERGEYEDFLSNKCTCGKCGEIVNLDNILSIKKANEKIIFYCNRLSCGVG